MVKLMKEYKSIDIIDWYKIKANTKVLVSDDGVNWTPAYFAHYTNNEVYVFCAGKNSFNTNYAISWKYTKLYQNDNYKN